ncbi:Putative transcriptional regulator [Paucilactobacillus oligofermentans DSM 15707 = LMG 22743]|uniref:TetR/AcrR family transcriptional regulator n=1 Tax=Paucilactobacillus oligofermentans TaxID=293371 RepID=UPI00078B5FC1|nr:TetR/AcrR family transcriptional regulator [Paucilactobacillus oligofermentans]CUS26877.1 Putative transcriptional regulator [Paucilactobacillus oligofermentans DSM 15707 = LMG 22743]
MKNKGNAKSQYSKQQILNALLVIMDNKPIYKITIKEICDYALISRKTFYRNFDTKIDVLSIEVDKIVKEYLNRLSVMDDLIVSNIALIIFNLVNENVYFLKN